MRYFSEKLARGSVCRLVMVCVLAFASSSAIAVNKCVEAAGKVTFSDQACSPTQSASAAGQASPARRSSAGADPATRNACFAMRDRIANLLEKGTGNLSEADFRSLIQRFESQCGEVAGQEMRKKEAIDAAAQAPVRQAQDAARCDIMRKELAQQRLEEQALARQGTPPNEAQMRQRAAFEATVAREC